MAITCEEKNTPAFAFRRCWCCAGAVAGRLTNNRSHPEDRLIFSKINIFSLVDDKIHMPSVIRMYRVVGDSNALAIRTPPNNGVVCSTDRNTSMDEKKPRDTKARDKPLYFSFLLLRVTRRVTSC